MSRRGLTLVELLVVIGIVSVLLALAEPAPAGAFTEEIKIRLEPEYAGQRGRGLSAQILGHGGER